MSSALSIPLNAHLIRATYDWLCDNGHTPYLQVLVDAHVQVPTGYVQDGIIVLNASPASTNRLLIDDRYISFQARFGGKVEDIFVPLDHIINIFSKETQDGYAAMSADTFHAIRSGDYQAAEATDSSASTQTPAASEASSTPTPEPESRSPAKKSPFTRVK